MGAPVPSTVNSLILEAFGISASGVAVPTLPIPVPSQTGVGANIASFHDGFPPATMTPIGSGGLDMRGPDMQGILYMLSANIAALSAGQLPVYNSTQSAGLAVAGYAPGAILGSADGLGLWLNQAGASNTVNPDTTGLNGWCPVLSPGQAVNISGLTNANVTLTAPQFKNIQVNFAGTLTGNVAIIFPGIAGMTWIVYNNCTGAYTLTCKTASGTGVSVPQGGGTNTPYLICSDGTNIWSPAPITVSTSSGVGTWVVNYNAGAVTYNNSVTEYNTAVTGLIPTATYSLFFECIMETFAPSELLGGSFLPGSGSISLVGGGFNIAVTTSSAGASANFAGVSPVLPMYSGYQSINLQGAFVNPSGNTTGQFGLIVNSGNPTSSSNILRLQRIA